MISAHRQRPAIPVCAAFLAGAATCSSLAACALAISALALLLAASRASPRLALLVAVAVLAGASLHLRSAHRDEACMSGPLRSPGQPYEGSFVGRVTALPETNSEGEGVLLLHGRRERRGGPRGAEIGVRVTVAPPPAGRPSALDELGVGDQVRIWCRLVRPRAQGNPGSQEPDRWLRARGLSALGRVKSTLLVERIAPAPPGLAATLSALKREARTRLELSQGPETDRRALMAAMLLGEREGLPPALQRRLREAGLIHLVAISGLHVGLLAGMLLALLRRISVPPPLLLLLAGALLPLFAILVGGRPPVARAAIGAGLALAGRNLGREGDPLNSLLLVGAALVAFHPPMIGDAGFQLTFVASAGILLGTERIAGRLPFPRPLALLVAVSASAYLATAPLVAYHFGRLAPVAVLSNLAAAPLCALLLVAGYGAILFAEVPLLGDLLASSSRWLASILLDVAGIAASWEGGGWRVPPPSVPGLLVYYASGLGALLTDRTPPRTSGRVLRMLFALLLVSVHAGAPPPGAGPFRVSVVDVGQGQCVVLFPPEGGAMVVDAGGGPNPRFDPGERIVLPTLDRFLLRRLEVLALSHADLDHAGGAAALVREKEIGELWLPPGWQRHPRLRALAGEARARGAAIVLCRGGDRFRRSGLPVQVLAPGPEAAALSLNDASLVLLAGSAPARLLVVGDLERAGERALLAEEPDCRSEALVAGHHGARNGSGEALLAAVSPRHAIVSCGYLNRFGHPHHDAVGRILAAGAFLWRTDLDGMVLLSATADGFAVETSRPRRRAERE